MAAVSTTELELRMGERAMSAEQSNSGNETTLAMVESFTTSTVGDEIPQRCTLPGTELRN